MIIDTLDNHKLYHPLHPLFARAFDFLTQTNLAALPNGRIEIQGSDLFASVDSYHTKPVSEGHLEAHRNYIDIQYIVSGTEYIGYAPLADQEVATPYDPARDLIFFHGSSSLSQLSQGMFAIYFPHDTHLPGRYQTLPGEVKKIVIKIAVA